MWHWDNRREEIHNNWRFESKQIDFKYKINITNDMTNEFTIWVIKFKLMYTFKKQKVDFIILLKSDNIDSAIKER